MIRRSEKVAFMGITTTSGQTSTTTFKRMKDFTEMSISKNPKEYSRKYVDEDMERSDVTGYSPSMSYKFDYDFANDVHKAIVDISDNEKTGSATKVTIAIVDLSAPTEAGGSSFKAIKRDFNVVPGSEGDDADTYTYSGDFKVAGAIIDCTATTSDEWQTATLVATE